MNFNTLLEFGHAQVAFSQAEFQPDERYERVIAVPFFVTSGKIVVDGPEEVNVQRTFTVPTGNYRLIAAQRVTGDEEEAIDLYFERMQKPLERSAVLVADDALSPPSPLIEMAEVAG